MNFSNKSLFVRLAISISPLYSNSTVISRYLGTLIHTSLSERSKLKILVPISFSMLFCSKYIIISLSENLSIERNQKEASSNNLYFPLIKVVLQDTINIILS